MKTSHKNGWIFPSIILLAVGSAQAFTIRDLSGIGWTKRTITALTKLPAQVTMGGRTYFDEKGQRHMENLAEVKTEQLKMDARVNVTYMYWDIDQPEKYPQGHISYQVEWDHRVGIVDREDLSFLPPYSFLNEVTGVTDLEDMKVGGTNFLLAFTIGLRDPVKVIMAKQAGEEFQVVSTVASKYGMRARDLVYYLFGDQALMIGVSFLSGGTANNMDAVVMTLGAEGATLVQRLESYNGINFQQDQMAGGMFEILLGHGVGHYKESIVYPEIYRWRNGSYYTDAPSYAAYYQAVVLPDLAKQLKDRMDRIADLKELTERRDTVKVNYEEAKRQVQSMIEANPWFEKILAINKGMKKVDVFKKWNLKSSMSGFSSGGAYSESYDLDRDWAMQIWYDYTGTYRDGIKVIGASSDDNQVLSTPQLIHKRVGMPAGSEK